MNKIKILTVALLLSGGILIFTPKTFAQGMMGGFNNGANVPVASVESTAKDEADGKAVYDRLMAKQVTCANLSDDEFDVLGDYFMGLRLGDTASHAYMNSMMTRMMGEEGEKQMHIALGKRLSGCDNSTPFPARGANFLPMMGLGGMMGNSNKFFNGGNSMMGYNGWNNMFGWNGFGLGSVFYLILLVFVILGIFFIIKRLLASKNDRHETKSAKDILEERYAKGEIDKKEFEEKKKDLSSY